MNTEQTSKNIFTYKNLNFAPTWKVHNKTQLKYDLNNFFWRIKLKGQFKDNEQANDPKWSQTKEKKHIDTERKSSFNWNIYRSSK